MKKIFFVLAVLVSAPALYAQEPADALRYSWYTSGGTARQQAVGGAMTSLGGDLSAAYVNPAGLAFYKTGDVVFSPGFKFLNNKSTYYGRTESDKKNNLFIGTSGIVLGEGEESGKKKRSSSAFALAVNRTASFSSNLLYRGENKQNSYSQKFLEEITGNNDKDGNSVASNYPFGTSLAFNTYWIDTINGGSNGNFQFQSRAPIGDLLQENKVTGKGGITELALSFAGSQNDKFFFGWTLGVPFLRYEKDATFTEADPTTNANNNFDYASINDKLVTSGVGVNIKMGVIYKPVEYVRLGLAFHSPTFYGLTDKYSTTITTNTESYKGTLSQSSKIFTNDNDAEYRYWHFSPYRIMASASYVLREIQDVRKQKGFLTADIEYVNYKASSYTTDPSNENDESNKAYLKSLNKTIDKTYKGTFNFKAGGELKFTTVMARLGIAYYGNPYKDLGHNEKGSKLLLSGGLGYRNKGMFIDLTYVHNMIKDVHYAYRLQNTSYAGAAIKGTNGNAVLTVGFKI